VAQYQDLSIIIPTLNEAESIGKLLKLLDELYPGAFVFVSDDNSSDDTENIVKTFAKVAAQTKITFLDRKSASIRGITVSVLDAVRHCETEFVSVIDGDLQHPPEVIAALYQRAKSGIDLVAGARLPYTEKQGWHRVFATRASTLVARLMLKFRRRDVADPMSGLFLIRRQILANLIEDYYERFELAGYKVLFDILRISPEKLQLASVFYDFAVREAGHSKLRPVHALYFFRSLFK
jgi:dolichol-phosphate mannosyltransferase